MIVSFRDEWPRDFFVGGCAVTAYPVRDRKSLQMIDDAMVDHDLRAPPGNHFEKPRGILAGFHSIRVNS